MRILVVNDDGIHAPGLEVLVAELSKMAEVTVVAPYKERSGASHSITLNSILRVEEVYKNGKFFGYSVGGTPVDCAKIALSDLLPFKPDYIFSGVNIGANLSTNVYYSGTVAAATEGVLAGITSVAVSLSTYVKQEPGPSAVMARKWLEILEAGKMPQKILYNLNVPAAPLEVIKGFAMTKLSPTTFVMRYERRTDPRGGTYYWLSNIQTPTEMFDEADNDISVMKHGYVSVTPLMNMDRTDMTLLKSLKGNGVLNTEGVWVPFVPIEEDNKEAYEKN